MPKLNRSRNIMRKPRAAMKMMATIPLVVLSESATAYLIFFVVFSKIKFFY